MEKVHWDVYRSVSMTGRLGVTAIGRKKHGGDDGLHDLSLESVFVNGRTRIVSDLT